MSKVITVTSGTGGAGKTFFCSNLGAALADKGNKIVVIDLDLNLKNLDMYLGLESKVVFNIKDVLDGVCRLRQALVRDKRFDHLFMIAGPTFNDERVITSNTFINLIEILKKYFDYIIIDTSTGKGRSVELAASVSDINIIIFEPSAIALRDTEIMIDYIKKIKNQNIFFTLNKVHLQLIDEKLVPTLNEISEKLKAELLGIIQYDENIIISNNYGEPVILNKDSYISKNFETILERLI